MEHDTAGIKQADIKPRELLDGRVAVKPENQDMEKAELLANSFPQPQKKERRKCFQEIVQAVEGGEFLGNQCITIEAAVLVEDDLQAALAAEDLVVE